MAPSVWLRSVQKIQAVVPCQSRGGLTGVDGLRGKARGAPPGLQDACWIRSMSGSRVELKKMAPSVTKCPAASSQVQEGIGAEHVPATMAQSVPKHAGCTCFCREWKGLMIAAGGPCSGRHSVQLNCIAMSAMLENIGMPGTCVMPVQQRLHDDLCAASMFLRSVGRCAGKWPRNLSCNFEFIKFGDVTVFQVLFGPQALFHFQTLNRHPCRPYPKYLSWLCCRSRTFQRAG